MREEGFVAEDAVEGGAGDGELAGGAEFVAFIEVEDVLDVLLNDRIEAEVVGTGGGVGFGGTVFGGGDRKVFGTDDAVGGFEEGGFKDGGELANVAGPVVLEEAGEGAGAEEDRALLVAEADALEEGLGEGCDVFAAQAQGRDGEADGGEAEGEVGEQQALSGHLAERGLRGSEEDGASGGAVLEGFEDAEEQALAGRREEIDAVEEGEAGESGGVGVGDEPLAGVAALEAGVGEWGAAEEVAGEGMLAGALFAFDGGDLDVGGGHVGLRDELAPGGADADELKRLLGVEIDEGKAGDRCGAGAGDLELSGVRHDSGRSSPPLMLTGLDTDWP